MDQAMLMPPSGSHAHSTGGGVFDVQRLFASENRIRHRRIQAALARAQSHFAAPEASAITSSRNL